MSRGPLDLIVVEFPGDVPGGELAARLADLVDKGTIRIIDIAFVRKDNDGTISTFELSERDGHGDYEAIDAAIAAVEGLIAEQDLALIGAELSPGTTAGVLLWENLWAAELRQTVLDAGGQMVLSERIPAAVVEALDTVNA